MSEEMCTAKVQRCRIEQRGGGVLRSLCGQVHGHPRPHRQEAHLDINARRRNNEKDTKSNATTSVEITQLTARENFDNCAG